MDSLNSVSTIHINYLCRHCENVLTESVKMINVWNIYNCYCYSIVSEGCLKLKPDVFPISGSTITTCHNTISTSSLLSVYVARLLFVYQFSTFILGNIPSKQRGNSAANHDDLSPPYSLLLQCLPRGAQYS